MIPDRTFLMLRHGLTDWNEKGVFQGRTDVALNAQGFSQAHETAQKFALDPADIIVSSPLLRAARTAEIIAAGAHKLFLLDNDLIECDFGSFEGQSIRDLMLARGISEKHELAGILPEDAENWALVAERALRCIARWQAEYAASMILFVSHDAVMQAVAEQLCGHWFDNQHCVPYRFEPDVACWSIVTHLSGE